MLCSMAQDYRFSNKIIRKDASSKLRRIIKEIDYEPGRGMYLSYPQLRRLLSGLAKEERNQVIDYIILR